MASILIVEDERNLAQLLRRHLEDEGHQVRLAFDGKAGVEAARETPDLIILDLMLPQMDGLTVCRQIRAGSGPGRLVPILMLTARAEEIDRVVGLEVGADDYLIKPFSLRELIARVRALLRRSEMARQAAAEPTPRVQVAGLVLDPMTRQAWVQGEAVELTGKEFDLLYLLAAHPGRVFSREFLLDRVWGLEAPTTDRTIDTHIYRLRAKLGDQESANRIVSVRGIGYKFARTGGEVEQGTGL